MAHPNKIASQSVLEKAGFGFYRHLPARSRLLFRRPRPVAQLWQFCEREAQRLSAVRQRAVAVLVTEEDKSFKL
jgi:hypothetical protein